MIDRAFSAVLFDLDGTLVDSTASVLRSWSCWADEFGVTLPERLEHGLPASVQVTRHLPPDRVAEGAGRIAELEITDTDGIAALPGAMAALGAIPPARWAIVTSCTTELAAARMAAAGIPTPTVLVTVDRITRGKPDPEGYRLAAHELGVDPADCLVVEDAPSGLAAGRAAGGATLGLTTTTAADLIEADLVVGSLGDVRFVPGVDGVRVERR